MKLNDISPFIRNAISGVMTVKEKADTFKPLLTPDCRLFLIVSGKGEFVINGKPYRVFPHDLILFQPGTKYTWCPSEECGIGYYVINFDYTQNFLHLKRSFHPRPASENSYSALETVTFDDADCLNSPIVIKNAVSLEERIRLIVVEFYLQNEFCDELLSSLLKSVLISVVRRITEDETGADGKKPFEVRKIIEFIQQNYMHELSNESIAAHFNFNSSYLSRKFKKHIGVSLHSFVINYRISTATELLRSQNMSITELMSLVGFSDLYHFSKCFKRLVGVSPTEYAKRQG